MEADGTLYISYRWARSGWLEKNADSTLLRGIALRAGQNLQEKLFGLPSDAPCAEAVSTADGSGRLPAAAAARRCARWAAKCILARRTAHRCCRHAFKDRGVLI